MPENDGTEPVEDNELLFRRIPVSMSWYSENGLSLEAFDPHKKRDISGISLSRAKYLSIEDAASGTSKSG